MQDEMAVNPQLSTTNKKYPTDAHLNECNFSFLMILETYLVDLQNSPLEYISQVMQVKHRHSLVL